MTDTADSLTPQLSVEFPTNQYLHLPYSSRKTHE